MKNKATVCFAPQLAIPHHTKDISFYEKAFGAKELRRWCNDDDSIHVAELEIEGALFHLHEENSKKSFLSPVTGNINSTLVGIFVPDVDAMMDRAMAAGAVLVSPATSYDYKYRQGHLRDPFGHEWLIEMFI